MSDKPSLDEIFGKAESISIPPSFGSRLLAKGQRIGALTTKGLIGDIPFLRKMLPESIRKIEPAFEYERPIEPITRLGRDIYALKGMGRLGLFRTGLRGAGIGMATAGTEKPEEILKAGGRGAIALPILKKTSDIAAEKVIKPLFQKGLRSSQQIWQDFLRAGYTVEKDSVRRAQEKGINYLMNKKFGFRDSDAFLKLGEKIHNNALELRRYWGDKVGRYRNMIFKNPKIKVSIENPRQNFINEITKPEIGAVEEISTDAINQLNKIKDFLNLTEKEISPNQAYILIDKLDDMISASKKGTLSLGKNAGRIVANLSRDLKKQIYKSTPRYISDRLKATEQKFAEIADVTDDVFDKLKFSKEGVAGTERVGATETALKRGLRADTPVQERQVWEKLDRLLPQAKKFMENYKDIFAAQDFSREGIGFLFRRLLLSPRMAATELSLAQPIMKGIGIGLKTGAKIAEKTLPPVLLRKSIKGNKLSLDEIFNE